MLQIFTSFELPPMQSRHFARIALMGVNRFSIGPPLNVLFGLYHVLVNEGLDVLPPQKNPSPQTDEGNPALISPGSQCVDRNLQILGTLSQIQ